MTRRGGEERGGGYEVHSERRPELGLNESVEGDRLQAERMAKSVNFMNRAGLNKRVIDLKIEFLCCMRDRGADRLSDMIRSWCCRLLHFGKSEKPRI